MTHTYTVKGMTCGGCVANVKKALEAVPGVIKAEVQKEAAPNAVVTMDHHIDTDVLQQAVKQYGNYQLSE